jgi:rod shape-determining protein MreC
MKHYFQRYGLWLLFAFAVLFPFVFYSGDTSMRRDLSVVERMVSALTRPVEFVVSGTSTNVSSFLNRYLDLRNAKLRSIELTDENARLKLQLQALAEVAAENVRLRGLLNLVQRRELKFRSCEVEAVDPSFMFRNIRISCGEKDGIVPGMGVVSAEGVVGVVMRTNPSFSDVLLVSDPNSNLDVIVARNRRRGILAGNAQGTMSFKHFDRGSRIQSGDEIVASGLTGPFPAGLIVGHVAQMKGDSESAFQDVEVEPAADISRLSEVLVLLQPSREVDAIRRIGGDDWLRKIVEGSGISRAGG